jgi:prevent-host-death family protein
MLIVRPSTPPPPPSWLTLAKLRYGVHMRVNVGQAKTDLSRLLARVEAGEEVEIARNGVPVARLVPVAPAGPGAAFLAARGSLAGQVVIADDFELDEDEIEAMLAADA